MSSESVDELGSSSPDLSDLEAALGYAFRDRAFLENALRHSSYAHDVEGASSNERLEFLGDAVVGLVVAHLLFESHDDWGEGDLTRALHQLVDKTGLSDLARQLSLGHYVQLGRTERQSRGEGKSSILANTMEAVLGAMFLDGGLRAVTQFARHAYASAFAPGTPRVERDPKTQFQEWVMAREGFFPTYLLIGDSDVDGDEERFRAEVRVGEEVWGRGVGRTKRAAEQSAAREALRRSLVEEAD